MAMPTVAAAAAVVPGVACGSSTRRVGVGNGNASAHAGGGCLAGGRRGAAAWVARARVAEAPPVAAEGSRQEAPAAPMVEIPVTCYQILGVTEKAEKDEIVKAAMELKNAEIEDGYMAEVSTCRQALLVDVRDKLLFEQEYAGSIKEKLPPRSSLHIPWSWLPAALCVLQEVGEEKLVLEIGQAALRRPDSRPYVHDVLLAMALAECSIAKASFEKSKVSLGFEALARAQYLLRRKPSLEKLPLLEQIEESLEELAPACTLELLSLPQTPENAERRQGAIAALCELLRQGLDVESSCRVHDWPCFLGQAMNKLLATEIVDLLSWDTLATTRKNKKSLESQSQRAVVDFNCFHVAMLAHFALGFSTRQADLISKAKTICDCLVASENTDLKFEESFCLYLLGEESGTTVFEKLQQLQSNGNSNSRNYGLPKKKDGNDKVTVCQSLELWLKDMALSRFADTRDCSPSLANFFGAPKRILSTSKQKLGATRMVRLSSQPSSSVSPCNRALGEQTPRLNSTSHLGEAVKQLAPNNLGVHSSMDRPANGSTTTSVPLKRNLVSHPARTLESWGLTGDIVGKLAYSALIGFALFGTLKLLRLQFGHMKPASASRGSAATQSLNEESTLEGSFITSSVRKHFEKLPKMLWLNNRLYSRSEESDLSSVANAVAATVCKQSMALQEAETLVKQWQDIKSEALGPDYQIDMLPEILDGSMLSKWQELALSAKDQSCYWRFVLLNLSVVRAEILLDESGTGEVAEIGAVLEEAAELVDESQPKKPSYYSMYEVQYILRRQSDGSWKICEASASSMARAPMLGFGILTVYKFSFFSEIPEAADILAKILSQLPINDAIRTSVLSRKWKYFWCSHTNLTLNKGTMRKPYVKTLTPYRWRWLRDYEFITRVDAVLRQHSGMGVQRMEIKFRLHSKHADHIDRWVNFAIASKTKELVVDLSGQDKGSFFTDLTHSNCIRIIKEPPYNLPPQLLGLNYGSYLRCLELTTVSLQLPADFKGFLDLKILSLVDMSITDEDVQRMLSKCNLLEFLEISYCEMVTSIRMLHPLDRLKHLVVDICPNLQEIELNCSPTTLKYSGTMVPLIFASTSRLTNISIVFINYQSAISYIITGFPSTLPRLETLTLHCGERERTIVPEGPFKFTYLRNLRLELALCGHGNIRKTDALDYAYILKIAPFMETLELSGGTSKQPKFFFFRLVNTYIARIRDTGTGIRIRRYGNFQKH
nr:F-box domain-containing protein [Oryza sativa Japonica Group]